MKWITYLVILIIFISNNAYAQDISKTIETVRYIDFDTLTCSEINKLIAHSENNVSLEWSPGNVTYGKTMSIRPESIQSFSSIGPLNISVINQSGNYTGS